MEEKMNVQMGAQTNRKIEGQTAGTGGPEGQAQYPAAQILHEALNIGEQMLICGGEVSRVEDTISRICRAYGMKKVDVFSITSCIIVTIQTEEGELVTQTRRVGGYETNLNRLAELNGLSREICAKRTRPEEVGEKIQQILAERTFPLWWEFVSYCLVSGMFTLFFGGSLSDGVASMIAGALLCLAVQWNRKKITNRLLFVLCEAVFTGFMVVAVVRLGVGQHVTPIVIGNIMLTIPGLSLTNSLRDMLSGDTMSGILRLCESLLMAVAIAGGIALVLYWFSPPETAEAAANAFGLWYYSETGQTVIQVVTSFFGSLGFAMLFHVGSGHVWLGALGGMIVWGIYLLTGLFTESVFWGYVIASFAGTCYGEWMARRKKTPATLFLVPAIITMIPGGSLYETMYCMVNGDYMGFFSNGASTVSMALAISVGILLASSLIRRITRVPIGGS